MLAILSSSAFISSAGYLAIFVLCVAQSCCVPTSSELTLGFAGVLSATGHMNLVGAVAVGVTGEVVGAYIAWTIGRFGGRAFVDRFGKYVLLTHADLDRAEDWYDRHERWGVFAGRLVPVIRNFVALPAGVAEVPLVSFGLLTLAGSLLWDGAMAGIGYGVGSRWHQIVHAISDAGYVIGGLTALVIIVFFAHRWRTYRTQRDLELRSGRTAKRHAHGSSSARGRASHTHAHAHGRSARRPVLAATPGSPPGSPPVDATVAAAAGSEGRLENGSGTVKSDPEPQLPKSHVQPVDPSRSPPRRR
ncbi:MAG: DedA family protein [Acidimicrobiales bacterium]